MSFLASSAAISASVVCAQAVVQIQLTPSLPEPQPVGTRVTWTVTATDSNPGAQDYRFNVRSPGGTFRLVRDYSPSTTLTWAESEREGIYDLQVLVRNKSTNTVTSFVRSYMVSSRVTGGVPVVSVTANPLVALYSAPPCPAGSRMRVRFGISGQGFTQSTPLKPCVPNVSMNFYIAGMLANTQYTLKHDILTGPLIETGPTLTFRTGAASGNFPSALVLRPATPPNSLQYPVLLLNHITRQIVMATDLSGRPIWYYNYPAGTIGRAVAGGTFLLLINESVGGQILREVDLASNTLRETNVSRVSEQLQARGEDRITSFHHEITRLPDGKIAVLGSIEKILTDVQGPGQVDVLGDMIIVLDTNLQVLWTWNSFRHLDVTRKAVLNETCTNGAAGCPPVLLRPIANDWTHSNSITYSAVDGNLLLSMRHQDWVIKVDYRNGSGTGNIVWRLGKDGDFAISSSDPYPWFSHQHDAGFNINGNQIFSVYDNGNTRRAFSNPDAHSRGQVYQVDESNRRVSLTLNADLGQYAAAVGTAERLANGNYHFDSGFIVSGSNPPFAQAVEVQPNGSIVYTLQSGDVTYRSFRMEDLYTP